VSEHEPVLDVHELAAGYGTAAIVRDVSLSVAAGEVVGILGPNGAGKSTVMRTIVGLTTHLGGTISLRGTEISGRPTHERSKMGIGYLPQQNAIFPEFTVEDNLELAGYAGGSAATDVETVYERFPQLRELATRRATLLSGGERKMLALGCVAITDPDLYLLDEPSDGLAPNLATDVFDRVDALATGGKAVLINEQNERVIDHLDRAYVLHGGTIAEEGDAERLSGTDRFRPNYLGGDPDGG